MTYNSLAELFTAIANSIRGKTGGTEKIVANDFPAAIDGISSGGGDDWYITDASYLFYNGARTDSVDALLAKCKGITDMRNMFNNCNQLTSLDVSGLDTGSVTNMYNAFCGSYRLTSLDVSNWNTGNVTSMQSTFELCSSLTSLNLSGWDTGKVVTMVRMFDNCTKLEEIIGFSATNTAGVTIAFPVGASASSRMALKRLTFRTDLPDGVYSIRSAINIKYCSFERDGMVEMFNTLPDVSGLGLSSSYTTITITGNPCVTNATLTAEDEAIATAKGWTLVK